MKEEASNNFGSKMMEEQKRNNMEKTRKTEEIGKIEAADELNRERLKEQRHERVGAQKLGSWRGDGGHKRMTNRKDESMEGGRTGA